MNLQLHQDLVNGLVLSRRDAETVSRERPRRLRNPQSVKQQKAVHIRYRA
jgi:hypothetical protein